MRRTVLLCLAPLALVACGKAAPLRLAEGQAPPPTPYGAAQPPTAEDLLKATPQARPDRTDELLKRSESRKTDEFDLPPE